MERNQLWGGRFAQGPSAIMQEINASIDVDKRLAHEDIEGSRAHARMLVKCGIISAEDGREIDHGLDTIAREIAEGRFRFRSDREDIHMNVEARLAELIGPAAGRLHTARSRNDQIATDFKMWVRRKILETDAALQDLQRAFLDQAAKHAETVMPGFTHLQTAQPVTFGHHCLAYIEMFARDRSRFMDAGARLNECPLGSAALAGTSFPIDRAMTARELGFDGPTRNSLDSVSDRDFALEFLSAAAIAAMHLSRFAEEIIIWCSSPYRFIKLSDQFTTGSSIMPQKRNPDAAELVRAKAAQIAASFQALAGLMKALPLAYAKDMQDDKTITFQAADALALSVAATAGMVRDMEADAANLHAAAAQGHSTATDLADYIVRVLKKPFREAHHITGQIVKHADQRGVALWQLPIEDLQTIEPQLTGDVFSVLSVEASAGSRTSFGGTAPERVLEQVQFWRERLS